MLMDYYIRYVCFSAIIGIHAYSVAGQGNSNSFDGLESDRSRRGTKSSRNHDNEQHIGSHSVHVWVPPRPPGVPPRPGSGVNDKSKSKKKSDKSSKSDKNHGSGHHISNHGNSHDVEKGGGKGGGKHDLTGYVSDSDSHNEGVSCFRKFRKKKGHCGGLMRKKRVFETADECCHNKGRGFSIHLHKIGKNKYSCQSCAEWENNAHTPKPEPPTATAAPAPVVKEFACFRKFRKKRQECGGPMSKRDQAASPEECCVNGRGFSFYGRNKVGKNKYTCMSCVEWERQAMSTSTTIVPTVPSNTTTAPAEWGLWGECSTSCGAGWQSRYRQCEGCDINHSANSQSRPCILNYNCPVDGSWGDWLPWQECSLTCGGGTRWRERRCNYPPPSQGGADCAGADVEQEACNMQACPEDGSWGSWGRFVQCSASCGPGTMSRVRSCNRPTPAHGGADCKGSRVNNRKCERRRCGIDGGWSAWQEWSVCGVSCGQGIITRRRQCNQPRPMFGGQSCVGMAMDQSVCQHETSCPVDGGWSEWSLYGRCQAPDCRSGHQLRSRSCNKPRPRNRGRMCRGRSVERTRCFNDNGCDVEAGVWCGWSAWSVCSATCRSSASVQTRTRDCACPRSSRGGDFCPGDSSSVQNCRGVPECDSRR